MFPLVAHYQTTTMATVRVMAKEVMFRAVIHRTTRIIIITVPEVMGTVDIHPTTTIAIHTARVTTEEHEVYCRTMVMPMDRLTCLKAMVTVRDFSHLKAVAKLTIAATATRYRTTFKSWLKKLRSS